MVLVAQTSERSSSSNGAASPSAAPGGFPARAEAFGSSADAARGTASGGEAVSSECEVNASVYAAGGSGAAAQELLGCCVVTLRVLGALLPPPFPSRRPARLYVGSVAVSEANRRQGVATQLLLAVETLGAEGEGEVGAPCSEEI